MLLQIGVRGVKEAMRLSYTKLLEPVTIAVYDKKSKVKLNDDETSKQIMSWREYNAKRLDKNPERMLKIARVPALAKEIGELQAVDEENLSQLLNKFQVEDDHHKAARVLMIFLEGGEKLDKMDKIICRNCNKEGHTVIKLIIVATVFNY
jgi:hypothetical protein